jgi:hypothetical protein
MMPMPVRRKARKMEKVKNFCRTATAKHVIPARRDHAVESEMSGGFKISREGGHWPRRGRFGYDRGRVVVLVADPTRWTSKLKEVGKVS